MNGSRIGGGKLLLLISVIMVGSLLALSLIKRSGASAITPGDLREQASRIDKPESSSAAADAHFHHVHVNVTDPKGAVDFYAKRFESAKARFGQEDALWTHKSWLLFNKVSTTPPLDLTSAIWHIGWGAEDVKSEYERQIGFGTKFFEPLTDISDINGAANAKPGSLFYTYVESPDHALIEINTATHHRFGHIHLFSEDPIAAGEWYVRNFGAKWRTKGGPSREPRFYHGVQIAPNAALLIDDINFSIFPIEYSKKAYADQWKGKSSITATKGSAIDHLAFSFDKLSAGIARLRANGVKVFEEKHAIAGGKVKHAFIEGPDKIRLELVEGNALNPDSK